MTIPVCFQCGLPVPPKSSETLTVNDNVQHFCCSGCRSVAMLINNSGLLDFYQFRNECFLAKTADIVNPEHRIDFTVYDDTKLNKDFVTQLENGNLQARLYIEGIHCTACTWLIEHFMGNQLGVIRISVNSVTHTALLEYENNYKLSAILEKFIVLGYQPKPSVRGQRQLSSEAENKTALLRLAVAGFAMVQVGMFAIALYAGALADMTAQWQSLFRWVSLFVALPVVFFSARPFFIGARRALLSRSLTMDVPVAIAIALAFSASSWATFTNEGDVYFDSVSMFTFFLLLGRYLEMRVRHKNEEGINQLIYLLPPYVMRVDSFSANAVRKPVALHQISAGDYLWIKEGEVIPVDGVVELSKCADNNVVSHVNESMLTGEATPIAKHKGDSVLAGTINMNNELLLRVIAAGSETRLSAIQQLMDDALHQKPQQISRADKISGVFVGVVLIISIVVAASWYFIDPARALWIALSVLVVTCPCALSLATPVSITAAIYRLRKIGLLVTKSHVVDTLNTVTHVIFDKTGTLTTGKMRIESISLTSLANKIALTEQGLLALAAVLERGSSHPIAKVFEQSISQNTQKITQQNTQLIMDSRQVVTGKGIEASVGGKCYRIGKVDFVDELHGHCLQKENLFLHNDYADKKSNTTIFLGSEEGVLGYFTLSDMLRSESGSVVTQLKEKSLSIELLSGDSEDVVKPVAVDLAVDRYQANASPEQKLSRIKNLQEKHYKVLMVGDGLNDLPVLSGADVSVAMSSASGLAQVQADSVLLRDDLNIIPAAMKVVGFCQKIIRQNLTWAVAYNVTALPLAAAGFVPPYAAAIGMSLSSLIVVCNATRIYRFDVSN